nr:hypothetical protein [Klebsiella pneumoniae]
MKIFLAIQPQKSEKPFNAYQQTLGWGDDFDGIPDKLKEVMQRIYNTWL